MKSGTLEGFGKVVRPHIFCGTVSEIDVAWIMIMANEKVLCLDVFGAFGTRYISIFCQQEGTHVVLIDNIASDFITLCFKKLTGPYDVARFVIETNELTFCKKFLRKFLFRRWTCCGTTTKGEDRSCVSFAIIMSLMRGISIPDYASKRASKECEGEGTSTTKVFQHKF